MKLLAFLSTFGIVIYSSIFLFELLRPLPKLKQGDVLIMFGRPGSGKTTWASAFTKKRLKKGIKVYSNVPINGALELKRSDIGTYKIIDGLVVIDEAGIDYNNRNFKSVKQSEIEWWKLIRHAKCGSIVFSQSYEDMDITIRRLAKSTFIISPSLIPGFFVARKFKMKIDIDETVHKPGDFYSWQIPIIGTYLIYGRRYWKMFDSYDMPEYPSKEWKIYGSDETIVI